MHKIPEIKEILEHELFISLESFRHHGSISCLEHSLSVAIKAFEMARGGRADEIATTRAALLHDFYLYDWHIDSPGLHGFKHPYIALRNAQKYFTLSNIEKDAIKRHMWPLTPIPPRYRESMIVSIADKAVTWEDYLGRMKNEKHELCSEL
ncbi:MAG: HD family phosphohydrolase [Spirochaetae bacterium HGW-Spirochaetae-1]|jgi:uncharacterized protein|nr:MAG: HD family phosphohydrolase [Spirochaetae bacterium HGW-Spirochaetae-1]